MAFDKAQYLESIQKKYGSSQDIVSNVSTADYSSGTPYTYQKTDNAWQTISGTLSDVGSDIYTGFASSIEGIIDFGASIVGNIGGLFDQNFKKSVEEFISTDYTTELYDNAFKYIDPFQLINMAIEGDANADVREYSGIQYLGENTQNIIHGIGQAGGQIGFMVATAGLGGGLGLGAKGVQTLSNIGLFTSAGGRGIQGALNEGLDLWKATAYGIESGAVEVLTEKLVGGAIGKLTGQSGLFDNVIDNVVNKVVNGSTAGSVIMKNAIRLGLDSLGEGFEEVVSNVADNTILRPLVGLENELSASEVGQDFLVGMISGALFNGISEARVNKKSGKNINSKSQNIMQREYTNVAEETAEGIEKIKHRFDLNIQQFSNKELAEEAKQEAIDKYLEEQKVKVEELNRQSLTLEEENVKSYVDTENIMYNENVENKEIINDTRGTKETSIGNLNNISTNEGSDFGRYGEESKGLRKIFEQEKSSSRNNSRLVVVKGKSNHHYVVNASGDVFYNTFEKIHNQVDKATSIIVDLHDKDFYNEKNGKSFIRYDGQAVGFVENNGNIVSALNANTKVRGFINDFLSWSVENGGKYMDCMNSIGKEINLPYTYSKNGFKPVAKIKYSREIMLQDHSVEDVNVYEEKYGQSDLIFMAYTGKNAPLYESFDELQSDINKLEYVEWDEAEKIRDEYLRNKGKNKVETEIPSANNELYKLIQEAKGKKHYNYQSFNKVVRKIEKGINDLTTKGTELVLTNKSSVISDNFVMVKKLSTNNEIIQDKKEIRRYADNFATDYLENLNVKKQVIQQDGEKIEVTDNRNVAQIIKEDVGEKEYKALHKEISTLIENILTNEGQNYKSSDLAQRLIRTIEKVNKLAVEKNNLFNRSKKLLQLQKLQNSIKNDIKYNEKANTVGAKMPSSLMLGFKILFNNLNRGGGLITTSKLGIRNVEQVRDNMQLLLDKFYNQQYFDDNGLPTEVLTYDANGNPIVAVEGFSLRIKSLIEDLAKNKTREARKLNKETGTYYKTQVLADLTTEEINNLMTVMRHLNKLTKQYSSVIKGNKKAQVKDEVDLQKQKLDALLGNKKLYGSKEKRSNILKYLHKLNMYSTNPRYVFQYYDLGDSDGIFNRLLFNNIDIGENEANTMYREVDELQKKLDKKDLKAMNDKITIRGINIDKGTAIEILCMLEQDWSREHLARTGDMFLFDVDNVDHKLEFDKSDIANDINKFKQELIDLVGKEYADKMTKHFFNSYAVAGKYKEITDNQLYGFTNVDKSGKYYPVTISEKARTHKVGDDINKLKQQAGNAKFNNNRTSTKGSLSVGHAYETLGSYLTQMYKYVAYERAIDSTNKALNYNIGTSENPLYLKDYIKENVDADFMKYWTNYANDLLGYNVEKRTFLTNTVEKIRANFSKAVLYANPKVMIQQVASVPTFLSNVSLKSLSKAIGYFVAHPKQVMNEMQNKSANAYYRYNGTAVQDAQTLSTTDSRKTAINNAVDKLGYGISFMDKVALAIGYQACKYETNNEVEHIELFNKAVNDTQPAITKSGASAGRRGALFDRLVNMFTSQTQQNTTMVLSSINKLQYAKARLDYYKQNGKGVLDTDTQDSVDTEYNKAKKDLKRTGVAILSQATVITLISMVISHIMNDDDEEMTQEDLVKQFASGMLENTILSFNPLFSNLYSFFNTGYEVNLNVVTATNNFLTGMRQLTTMVTDLCSGKEVNVLATFNSILKNVSYVFGIPYANLEKYGIELISWFSPSTALKMNNALYSVSASKSTQTLNSYIKSGKDDLAKEQLSNIMATYKTGSVDDKVLEELFTLYKEGYDVLPSSVSNIITIDEVGYDMKNKSNKQKFMQVYSESTAIIKALMKTSYYSSLSNSAKANAIKRVYNSMYSLSKYALSNNSMTLSGKFDKVANILLKRSNQAEIISKLSVYLAKISEIEEDKKSTRKEKVQKFINSLALNKNEKYLLFYLAGYNISEEQQKGVKSYLKQKGGTNLEVDELFGVKDM